MPALSFSWLASRSAGRLSGQLAGCPVGWLDSRSVGRSAFGRPVGRSDGRSAGRPVGGSMGRWVGGLVVRYLRALDDLLNIFQVAPLVAEQRGLVTWVLHFLCRHHSCRLSVVHLSVHEPVILVRRLTLKSWSSCALGAATARCRPGVRGLWRDGKSDGRSWLG